MTKDTFEENIKKKNPTTSSKSYIPKYFFNPTYN